MQLGGGFSLPHFSKMIEIFLFELVYELINFDEELRNFHIINYVNVRDFV